MAKKLKALWKKYSDAGAVDDKPPTPGDSKLRVKHVMDSVPYNIGHATDHIEEVDNQLDKLAKTDPKLAKKTRKEAASRLHKVEQKVSRG